MNGRIRVSVTNWVRLTCEWVNTHSNGRKAARLWVMRGIELMKWALRELRFILAIHVIKLRVFHY